MICQSIMIIKCQAILSQLAAGGATRNALTKEMICNLKIALPVLEEQRKITSLLDSIQAKIEVNKWINNNLQLRDLCMCIACYKLVNVMSQ